MSVTSSPQARLLALIGLLALLGLAAGAMTLARTERSSSAEPTHVGPRRTGKPHQAAPKPGRTSTPTFAELRIAAALEIGLPRPVASLLASHEVVVVSLGAPDAQLDEVARQEAEAGAQAAGAGFVAVDVTGPGAAWVASSFHLVEAPAVLVIRRPGNVYVRLDGFTDRDTVAQAAVNAAS